MRAQLAVMLADLWRVRRYLALTPVRLHALVGPQALHRPPVGRPQRPALWAGAHARRGLSLTWWQPQHVHTLMAVTRFKRYGLGFDTRVAAFKDVAALQTFAEQVLEAPGWRQGRPYAATPFVRELGAWGASSAYSYTMWGAGFAAAAPLACSPALVPQLLAPLRAVACSALLA